MAHQYTNIPLNVTYTAAETPGYVSLFFARPLGFEFQPGDWIDIRLPRDQPPGGTIYSLASSPLEPELRITFRQGVSLFKQALSGAQPGDRFGITQYGNYYDFRLTEYHSSVLIAGGVGVAPFRSMLGYMAENTSGKGGRSAVRLIYFNTSDAFLYRQDLDAWQRHLPGLDVHYIVTRELHRKDRERLLHKLLPDADNEFYVAGPSGMVRHTAQVLEQLGVPKQRIRLDDFGLY